MSDGENSPRSPVQNNGDDRQRSPGSPGQSHDDTQQDRRHQASDGGRSASPPRRDGRTHSNGADSGDISNPGNNLYVANLSHRVEEADLQQMFSKFGRLQKCEIIVDPTTRESRGFAFVTFEDVRDAADAVQELNGTELHGRPMRVEHAKRKCGHPKTPGQYLGPKLASVKFNRDNHRGRSRDRPSDRRRSRSRSRDRHSRRSHDRMGDRRRYDDRGSRNDGYRNDGRRSRR